jgi:hypothetical protein
MQAADVAAAANSRIRGSPSTCGYSIVLTLKAIKKEETSILR